jgi:hypothetical protein
MATLIGMFIVFVMLTVPALIIKYKLDHDMY